MFFKPTTHAGNECRDGGLKENNPLQLAVNECKNIWRDDVEFDVIISVGSGHAKTPQRKPASWNLLPSWLTDLFNTLISTMDGEEAWRRFTQDQEPRIRDRASRMNVRFDSDQEPALDEFKKVNSMERLAETFPFHERRVEGAFAPIAGGCESSLLDQLADRLRASMYFFQLGSITKFKNSYSVTGWIGCQIEPEETALPALLQCTTGFQVKGRHYSLPTRTGDSAFRLPVDFNQQDIDAAIRIDVNFGMAHSVTIGGFPLTLKVSVVAQPRSTVSLYRRLRLRTHRSQALLTYWNLGKDDRVPSPSEVDGPAMGAG